MSEEEIKNILESVESYPVSNDFITKYIVIPKKNID